MIIKALSKTPWGAGLVNTDLGNDTQIPAHASKRTIPSYLFPRNLSIQDRSTSSRPEGKEFASDLQVRHMSYLKSALGVGRTTTNWAVLRECGREPLQFF
eukprot:616250-Pelagomonas_calceolata.AAC.1